MKLIRTIKKLFGFKEKENYIFSEARIVGTILRMDKPTFNGTVYPKETIEKMARALKRSKKQVPIMIGFNPTDMPIGKVSKVYIKGNDLRIQADIFDKKIVNTIKEGENIYPEFICKKITTDKKKITTVRDADLICVHYTTLQTSQPEMRINWVIKQ